MSDRKPGVICGSRLGTEWVDDGTLCMTRSSSPGPLGLFLSMALGAAPKNRRSDAAADQRAAHHAMFAADIEKFKETEFARTDAGKELIPVLEGLLKSAKIRYDETVADGLGDWDGSIIRVTTDFEGKMYHTIVELVHEATHALWTKKRREKAGKKAPPKPSRIELIDDEFAAQKNQLEVYKEFQVYPGIAIPELDIRVTMSDAALRAKIEERFKDIR